MQEIPRDITQHRKYIKDSFPDLSLEERRYFLEVIKKNSPLEYDHTKFSDYPVNNLFFFILDFIIWLREKENEINAQGEIVEGEKFRLIPDEYFVISKIEYDSRSSSFIIHPAVRINENLISEDYIRDRTQEYYDRIVEHPNFKGF